MKWRSVELSREISDGCKVECGENLRKWGNVPPSGTLAGHVMRMRSCFPLVGSATARGKRRVGGRWEKERKEWCETFSA